jgi:hypothetical protein
MIPDDIYDQINATQATILQFHESLALKWKELRDNGHAFDYNSQKITTKMTEMLEGSLRKLQEAGEKFMKTQKPLEIRVNKFSAKVSKIFEGLEAKWEQAKEQWYKSLEEDTEDTEEGEEEDGEASRDGEPETETEAGDNAQSEPSVDTSWYWERAEGRKELKPEGKGKKDWMWERAKDREIQRLTGDPVVDMRGGHGGDNDEGDDDDDQIDEGDGYGENGSKGKWSSKKKWKENEGSKGRWKKYRREGKGKKGSDRLDAKYGPEFTDSWSRGR